MFFESAIKLSYTRCTTAAHGRHFFLLAQRQLFLHQTQFKDSLLAGRYTYVRVESMTTQGSNCLVVLNTPLRLAFRSGEL